MSYSRWIASKWYTYWLAQGISGAGCADKEVFRIGSVASFTHKALREQRKDCLETIRKETDCSEKELAELGGYMDEFCAEIDAHYRDLAKERRSDGQKEGEAKGEEKDQGGDLAVT